LLQEAENPSLKRLNKGFHKKVEVEEVEDDLLVMKITINKSHKSLNTNSTVYPLLC
jgi:hypothetical protein